ncbi:HAMP domain-containing sensor histidine kinase [Hydrogenimonas thermophila]|uniref:histidine kinase n=1 Tax=Hydrogenimonas thermophila TaxID=223786 RepID=A0A1I5KVB2_9BACT|nr:ATP-binding protein [Hydrogenimonas thermophila]WOE69375.1 ATP-binding protein [Hydrogenimonas thermophila]WOE71885.1 ATP-binding protein [Hydrogenimonas thermophila]SFO88974.1 His Kinase A (phospho-acceptor) domain-containing protein [Hydrogenimonas thermophila]
MLKRYFKLPQIFFINFLLLLSGTLLIASFIVYYSVQEIEVKQFTNQLRSEIAYVRTRLDEGKSLEVAANEMSEIMGRPLRVTLIAMDGTVLFDNEADVSSMENHANRPEVMAARRDGFGTAVRYSQTVKNDRIYVAKTIKWNSKPAILRLSVSLETIMQDFRMLWFRMASVFLLALVTGYFISRALQRRIDEELGKLTDYLKAIADKNYNANFSAGFSKEFTTIAVLLKKLAKRLEKNEKKKRKYNAKIRLISKQRSDMISAISHEFKNPVAAIMGYTETLLDDDGVPVTIRKKFLQRIEQNARRITQMIDRLSFMTRMESSEIQPEMSGFDMEKVVKDAIYTLSQKYQGRNIKIQSKPVNIYADKTMMEMTVINLIDNALKYSEDDVEVVLNEKEFCVIDKGDGIPEKEIDEITKKFYRINKNSWDNSMGLGLAIVSYILKLHNSHLHISSEVGKGTKICFHIPSFSQIKS